MSQAFAPPIYALPGTNDFPQVEPEASFWLRCPVPKMPNLAEVQAAVEPLASYPNDESLDLLREFRDNRTDDTYFEQNKNNEKGRLSVFLSDELYFSPPPRGAVLGSPPAPIRNGVELATLFEAETPGLWHRHVLDILLDPRLDPGAIRDRNGNPAFPGRTNPPGLELSPPRQALIWAALDVAIAGALNAAWHYKWLADGLAQVAYRRRPMEADNNLFVLYDHEVDPPAGQPGRIVRNRLRGEPVPSPGTPRHPAYPSGHSTYSAAASEVLGCFFPTLKGEFDALATNTGYARLWGGVHWLADHAIGDVVGRAVGKLIISQLNASDIPVRPASSPAVPDRGTLQTQAGVFEDGCGDGDENFCGGVLRRQDEPRLIQNRS